MQTFIVVVGAGQAGLSAGYHLRRAGLPFVLLERLGRVGDVWRKRYASLTLFTPREFSALEGLALEGNPNGYASRDEFADYLEAYARRFHLPVRPNTEVVRLSRDAEGGFRIALASNEVLSASHVIVATGGFQLPIVPELGSRLAVGIQQLTTESYRQPSDVREGPVLVVGDGATGRDIAIELARSMPVLLATGKPRRLLPETVLGVSTWRWLDTLGLLRVSRRSAIGRFMRRADPFPNRGRSFDDLRRAGVTITPRLTRADGEASASLTVTWRRCAPWCGRSAIAMTAPGSTLPAPSMNAAPSWSGRASRRPKASSS